MTTNPSSPGSSGQPVEDPVLIAAFVNYFVQSQPLLLANANLRIEPTFDTLQLLSKKEGLLATAALAAQPLTATVRYRSSYWDCIHQTLIGQSLFPIPSLHKGLRHTYQRRQVPAGYQMHCTSVKELWRTWWGGGVHSRFGISMELLILNRGPLGRQETWHPVRNMESRLGAIFVRLLGGEIALQPSDQVIWLKKEDAPAEEPPEQPLRPDLRGIYRRRSSGH